MIHNIYSTTKNNKDILAKYADCQWLKTTAYKKSGGGGAGAVNDQESGSKHVNAYEITLVDVIMTINT